MTATRAVARGRRGMVAAAHPLAVRIGVELLQQGAGAVDAAIGVNAALGFLEPTGCGIGGDLFAIVWSAEERRLFGLEAAGRSPLALTADRVPPAADGTIPLHSPWAWSVPGAVAGWFALHERFGRLPFGSLLGPAIEAAEAGAVVPPVIAAEWAAGAARFRDYPGFARTFLPAPAAGDTFSNPALARAYRALVEEGRAAFYEGAIADSILRFSREHGGLFEARDLAETRAGWIDPVSTSYRGVRLHQLAPPGQGLAALQMLNLLEGFDLAAMGRDSPDFWHLMIEAKKLAFEDRARFYADPGYARVPVAGLIDKGYARERARSISIDRAAERLAAGHPRLGEGDTTYLAVADRDGNMVSLIQSNFTGFGSGYVVPDWGFGLQNRGALFNLDPASANRLEPGKRPFHTIIPAFATRDGEPWLAFGVMGADMQPQGQVQVLVNLLDLGMELQQAGDAPRCYHAGSSTPTGLTMTDGGEVHLEAGLPPAIGAALRDRGHRLGDGSGPYGGYQAVARTSEGWEGATERRKDGCALGY